jgi:hypothetical protein
MKLVGLISTAVLSLTLGVAAPAFAQEQHDQQEDQKAKPDQSEQKKAQPAKQEEKPAAQPDRNAKPTEKTAQQDTRPAEKNAQQTRPEAQAQRPSGNGGNRIPDARFKANFGQQHTFRVSQADYSSHRFQYGGYSFGFVDAWPSNWLYTQNVYVIEINGVYYLCNASYPGVNLELSFTL